MGFCVSHTQTSAEILMYSLKLAVRTRAQAPTGVCTYKRVTYAVTNPCNANVSMHYTVR